ncbi:MAG: tRNA (N6-isopentenyl adenosine(37)-C2)-methylthiotransferase MiaB [Treponema sp.]|nr:tRNA (N6-isopentenyl adenosine(37)-C2)-methylthiotransferase MiaB [Treponema sp.]
MQYFFETYGCQMNTAESAALALVLKERGWEAADTAEVADLVVINTCSVRATAEQRVFGRLALYAAEKKKRPAGFTLVVAGCMASRLGETLKEKEPAVDYVMGTDARSTFPMILEAVEKSVAKGVASGAFGGGIVACGEKPAFSFSAFHAEPGSIRSFIPIMHGCNNFCAYCIVPYTRGREISRDPASILAEIRLLAERGVREITLLGQNVNSYLWEDESKRQKIDFPALLEMVADEMEKTDGRIRWARFLSSHPKDLSSKAIQVMAERRVYCRHLHLCVQHGSNVTLAAMNRAYTRERYLDLVAELREAMPGISLSTDLLIGFPGETEEDTEETLALMEQVKFLYSYMYHYNPREGTAAYALPDRVSDTIKQKRLAQVIALQKQHTVELLQARIGAEATVLIEGVSRKSEDELICRTERDEMVVAPGDSSLIGEFAEAKLSLLRGNTFRSKETRILIR